MVQIIERARRAEEERKRYINGLEYLSYLCGKILHPDFPKGKGFHSRVVTLSEEGQEFIVKIEYSPDGERIAVVIKDFEGFIPQVLYLKGWRNVNVLNVSRVLETSAKVPNEPPTWNLGWRDKARPVNPEEIEEYKQLLEKMTSVLGIPIPTFEECPR